MTEVSLSNALRLETVPVKVIELVPEPEMVTPGKGGAFRFPSTVSTTSVRFVSPSTSLKSIRLKSMALTISSLAVISVGSPPRLVGSSFSATTETADVANVDD